MKIYIGTSGYGYKEWKGSFYPQKISPKEMLSFYSERFNSVEINNTFYHMPKMDVLMSWAGQVPDDFIFALKAPQVITHLKRLRNVEVEIEYLLQSLPVLGKKLGPVLFQFPGSFRADIHTLEAFLDLLPDDMLCAFEFRSPSWFSGSDMLHVLREKGCSLCISDAEESPANEIVSTAAWGYLRLRHSDYTDADLSRWLQRILSQKWERAYVFFKHEGEAIGPEMAMRFQELAGSGVKKRKKENS